MAKGQSRRRGAWDRCVAELQERGCRFRMRRTAASPFIQVREVVDGTVMRQFTVRPYRHSEPDEVELVRELCLEAELRGSWPEAAIQVAPDGPRQSWAALAAAVAKDVEQRIVKRGSRVHVLNHLRLEIGRWRGPVEADRLEQWARELDPLQALRSFNRRLETIAQIERSGQLPVTETLRTLRALRPSGAAERIRKAQTMRIRAIPTDAALEAWLDGLGPFHQWLFGVIATYGLRPHEAWHALPPDEQGWVTIPGDMRTKTCRHFAPPVPRRWLLRYRLAEQWPEQQAALLARWRIQWETVGGVRIAVNNVALGGFVYKEFQLRGLERLWASVADGEGQDWCRPYDFRHAYAIRCAASSETAHCFDDEMAQWMGHGVDVHRRIYLRWLPASREKAALQERFRGGGAAG